MLLFLTKFCSAHVRVTLDLSTGDGLDDVGHDGDCDEETGHVVEDEGCKEIYFV